MMLTGELTFNAVAVKIIEVEKVKKSTLISLSKEESIEKNTIDDFPDHPLQGEVVGIGPNVKASGTCKVGDIVLLKVSQYPTNPYPLNDKGTIYSVYNEADILLVRTPINELIQSAVTAVEDVKPLKIKD